MTHATAWLLHRLLHFNRFPASVADVHYHRVESWEILDVSAMRTLDARHRSGAILLAFSTDRRVAPPLRRDRFRTSRSSAYHDVQ